MDAAEAGGVEEEEVEAGEAQGDNRLASNMLSDIPLFVHFFLSFFSFLDIKENFNVLFFDCALVALLTFFYDGLKSLY